jgi:hypothetical protein
MPAGFFFVTSPRRFNFRKIVYAFLVFMLVYVFLGIGFHITWKSALDACREERTARGEFVEPEVFGNALGVIFDVTFWPLYSWANLTHFGTPFSTPCTHDIPRWRPTEKRVEAVKAVRLWESG